jgi:hypothetical protein
MFIKINLSVMSILLLTACFGGKPFQPHPPTFTQWAKNEVSADGVKEAMLQCGYKDLYGYGGDRDSTLNDHAKRENCMFRNGFRYKDGDQGLCTLKSYKDIPACQSNSQQQKKAP